MKFLFTFYLALLMLSQNIYCRDIQVPVKYATIQSAIDAALNGDRVLVADGLYFENINFLGKAITIGSYFLIDGDSSHIAATIIDGRYPANPDRGSVVSFVSGEDTNSVIIGFTITGGSGTLYNASFRIGGGIYIENSGARISHNKIINNSVTHDQSGGGGGIGAWPEGNENYLIVEDNIIESNSVIASGRTNGGGIRLTQGRIHRNKIRSNTSQSSLNHARGGGIAASCTDSPNRSTVKIYDNEIINNYSETKHNAFYAQGGGVYNSRCNIELVSNTISHNLLNGPATLLGSGVQIFGVLDDCFVQDNLFAMNSHLEGECQGGGLRVTWSEGVIIQGNRFEKNKADMGGALRTGRIPGGIISDNEFIDNIAVEVGGGMSDYNSAPLTVTKNLFRNNKSFGIGGGFDSGNSDLILTNNIIIGNEAQYGGGIEVWLFEPAPYTVRIINNTIANNLADEGAGIASWDAKTVVLNTICWNNDAAFAPEILVQGGELSVAHSDIRFGEDGIEVTDGGIFNWLNGNISCDPGFVINDSLFHVSDNSISLCGGIDSIQIYDSWHCASIEDFGENLRPQPAGTFPDMGAWESDVVNYLEEWPESFVPNSFALLQNYPNPFNPITNIKFQIPSSEFVTLKIYNLLGQEVATLVSEELKTGSYKYSWDAGRLASGVYLYKLQAGEFVETRKMVLLR